MRHVIKLNNIISKTTSVKSKPRNVAQEVKNIIIELNRA